MRTRAHRRHLTSKYQARQYCLYQARVNWSRTEPSKATVGRWKKHSAFDCGRSHCNMCCNVRRSPWAANRDRYTRQERINYDDFWVQIDQYFS